MKAKTAPQQPKAPEKKAWKAEDYASLTIPVEEVKDIKTAFDIFDGDLSGIVDPQELKDSRATISSSIRFWPNSTTINQAESISLSS